MSLWYHPEFNYLYLMNEKTHWPNIYIVLEKHMDALLLGWSYIGEFD